MINIDIDLFGLDQQPGVPAPECGRVLNNSVTPELKQVENLWISHRIRSRFRGFCFEVFTGFFVIPGRQKSHIMDGWQRMLSETLFLKAVTRTTVVIILVMIICWIHQHHPHPLILLHSVLLLLRLCLTSTTIYEHELLEGKRESRWLVPTCAFKQIRVFPSACQVWIREAVLRKSLANLVSFFGVQKDVLRIWQEKEPMLIKMVGMIVKMVILVIFDPKYAVWLFHYPGKHPPSPAYGKKTKKT